MTEPSPFIETADFWTSFTRQGDYPRGMGKWMLHADQPHRLFGILKEEMQAGKLAEAYSIKTLTKAPQEGGAVYVHTGPYTDQDRILGLAEELQELDGIQDFHSNCI